MSATAVDISKLTAARAISASDVVVGKDILELLSSAMYVDPLTVLREYVQNAADSIDEARQLAGHQIDSRVLIDFDHAARSLRIRDFGVGVSTGDFVKRLTSFGASAKRGTTQRGFRGVGRLAALGYCQELVFRSRSAGDSKAMEMRWNARLLRECLRDPLYLGSLLHLVSEVASTRSIPTDGYPPHFFEVELVKVARIRNDVLLNEAAVASYLSQIAPLPFSPSFSFGTKIQEWLDSKGVPSPISIHLNGSSDSLFHRAQDAIGLKGSAERFVGVDVVELKNGDGEVLAFGWLLDHDYAGALDKGPQLGGMRLRVGNLQIGDASIAAPHFSEPRFNAWTVCELHIAHPRIVPNGRRDDFEPTPQYSELQDELRALASGIGGRIRAKSESRRGIRRVRLGLQYVEGWLEVASNRKLAPLLRQAAAQRAQELALEAAIDISKVDPSTTALRQLENNLKGLQARINRSVAQSGKRAAGRKPVTLIAIEAIFRSSKDPAKYLTLAESVVKAASRS